MSALDKQKLANELRRFNQRKLLPGEVVLLSYAIANHLPVFEKNVDNPNMEMIKHYRLIESVLYRLCEHASWERDTLDIIKGHVVRFLLWRTAVAFGVQKILFSGSADSAVEELGAMNRYVDPCILATVSDLTATSNWALSTFNELVEFEIAFLSLSKEA